MDDYNDCDFSKFADCGIMAIRYRELIEELDRNQKHLWRYIRGEKNKSGQYVPVFRKGAEGPLTAINETEDKLHELIKDAATFFQHVGEYRSFREFQVAVEQEARKIKNSEYDLRVATEHAARRGVPVDQIANDPLVREAALKLDKIKAESRAEELVDRLKKAREILEKYK